MRGPFLILVSFCLASIQVFASDAWICGQAHGMGRPEYEKPIPAYANQLMAYIDPARNEHFLLDDHPPLPFELRHWRPSLAKSSLQLNIAKHPLGFQPVLQLLQIVREPSEFIFIGNENYPAFLMVKGLLVGTPVEKSIWYLPASREVSNKAVYGNLNSFFSKMRLRESSKNIVLIDSVAYAETPNKHEVLTLAQAVRIHLIQGGQDARHVAQRVIALGSTIYPGITHHFYATKDLQEYRQQLSSVPVGELSATWPMVALPYVKTRILDWEGSVFGRAYGNSEIRWSGKFNQVDDRQLPVGERGLSQELDRGNPDYVVIMSVEDRRNKALLYREILEAGEKAARENPSLQRWIQEFLKIQNGPAGRSS